MVDCPNCGTPNREGSRFCSECGEALPASGIRCPMCDTVNPATNVYCQNCNARLVPMTSRTDAGSDERPSSEDWLDELRGSADRQPEKEEEQAQAAETGTVDEEGLEPAEIPDWLQELGPVREDLAEGTGEKPFSADASAPGPDVPEVAEDETAPERAEIPDWLLEMEERSAPPPSSAEAKPRPTPQPGQEQEEEKPDRSPVDQPDREERPAWLDDVLPPDEDRDAAPSPVASAGGEEDDTDTAIIEIPEWLKDAEAGVPPQPPDIPVVEPEPAPADAEMEEEVDRAVSPEEPGGEADEIPSWLREPEGDLDRTAPGESISPFTEALPDTIETPEWLTELLAAAPEEEVEASPFATELALAEEAVEEDLERADIPEWLQELRPRPEEPEPPVRGPVETEGLLQGLRGLLPASYTASRPLTFEDRTVHQPGEATLARAELLQTLLRQPTAQPKAGPPRAVSRRQPDAVGVAERWLVAAVLTLAVVGSLLAPLVTNQRLPLTRPPATSLAADLHRVIEDLDVNDHVLVAFDYGPSEADELDAAAEPVLAHLLERQPRISVVTTQPDGTLVAASMMDRIAGPEDTVRMAGYRPGAAAAMSQLLSATDQMPSLVLVLTSRSLPLRFWIEQGSARYGDQLQMAAVGSAALEPVASAYLDVNAGQLTAAIHGIKGAASYEALRGPTGRATERLEALAGGHIAIVVLMVAGAALHGLTPSSRERR